MTGADDAGRDVLTGTIERDVPLRLDKRFRYFWAAQGISSVGTAVSGVAFPLVGVITLQCTPFEMGLISWCSTFPAVVVGPFVGTSVDRMDARRVMITADVLRAAAIGLIPVAAVMGLLTVPMLMIVGASVGILSQFFLVANLVFLPTLVGPSRLADGNSKIEATESAAYISGPGVAGALVSFMGAAGSIAIDAVSYALSAVLLTNVSTRTSRRDPLDSSPKPAPRDRTTLRSFATDTRDGVTTLWRDDVLRWLTVSYAALAFFARMQVAILLLYLVRHQHLPVGLVGALFSISGFFGFVGAASSGRLITRYGAGRLVVAGQLLSVAGGVLLGLLAGGKVLSAAILLVGEACFAIGVCLYGVASRTLLQVRVTESMLGRVLSTNQVVIGTLAAFGGLAGGALSEWFGYRSSLVGGGLGMLCCVALIARKKVWTAEVAA